MAKYNVLEAQLNFKAIQGILAWFKLAWLRNYVSLAVNSWSTLKSGSDGGNGNGNCNGNSGGT